MKKKIVESLSDGREGIGEELDLGTIQVEETDDEMFTGFIQDVSEVLYEDSVFDSEELPLDELEKEIGDN